MKEIPQDPQLAEDISKKAEHNLEVMQYLIDGGHSDWAVSASFYAHYHCLLAILAVHGFESRNQDIVGLRERFQYGKETSYEQQKTSELLQQTKEFVEKIKVIIQAG